MISPKKYKKAGRIGKLKMMVVKRTSVFPASKDRVFGLLKEIRTLQYIARPYASFECVHKRDALTWEEGAVFQFRFRVFCIIPYGVHTIRVIRFSEDTCEIYTNESNPHVPVWNHRIILKSLGDGRTAYTDEVEIEAGWKTALVYLWAKSFYAHRQRKWIMLLKDRGGPF